MLERLPNRFIHCRVHVLVEGVAEALLHYPLLDFELRALDFDFYSFGMAKSAGPIPDIVASGKFSWMISWMI
jgi:hypothetical protein